MKVFYLIWAWRPNSSCDPDAANKISFPLPKEAPHKIWLGSAQRFRRRRCLKLFTTTYDGRTDDGRRTDGRRLDGYTKSSPCEPNGSGELKTYHMSRAMRKPDFAYAKTKTQISCAVTAAYLRLCFHHIDSTISLLLKCQASSHLMRL